LLSADLWGGGGFLRHSTMLPLTAFPLPDSILYSPINFPCHDADAQDAKGNGNSNENHTESIHIFSSVFVFLFFSVFVLI
jgi:hypothetical protein